MFFPIKKKTITIFIMLLGFFSIDYYFFIPNQIKTNYYNSFDLNKKSTKETWNWEKFTKFNKSSFVYFPSPHFSLTTFPIYITYPLLFRNIPFPLCCPSSSWYWRHVKGESSKLVSEAPSTYKLHDSQSVKFIVILFTNFL